MTKLLFGLCVSVSFANEMGFAFRTDGVIKKPNANSLFWEAALSL